MPEEERVFRIATVEERKVGRVREFSEACRRVESRLADYASRHGGRFLLVASFMPATVPATLLDRLAVDRRHQGSANEAFSATDGYQEAVRLKNADHVGGILEHICEVCNIVHHFQMFS